MQPRWTRGLTDEEAKQLKKDYMQAALLRERLIALLEQEIDKSLKEMKEAAKSGTIQNLTEYYTAELSRQSALEDVIKLIQ